MPNNAFRETVWDGEKFNFYKGAELALEDTLDDDGCIDTELFFDTPFELADMVNEINRRGYTLVALGPKIREGEFILPRTEEEYYDEEYTPYSWRFSISAGMKWIHYSE